MGSPPLTSPPSPLSSKTTEASLAFKEDKIRTRQRSRKRSKVDMHDGRAFYHTPTMSMRPPPVYAMPYSPGYPYHPAAHYDAAVYSPISPSMMYYQAGRYGMYNDGLPLESHIMKMNLGDEKVPVKSTDFAPPVPPSTPSSAITEVSLPTSIVSAQYTGSESAHSSEEQQAPRERANSAGSFYRTKPCKFYHEYGRCVKGNRCNFIHDFSQARPRSASESEPQEQSTDTAISPSSRRRRATKRPSHVMVEDTDKRSNYYPVTWRVISGRVMMGGQREVCQDYLRGACHRVECKYAHPAIEEEDEFSDTSSSSYYDARDYYSPVSHMPYPNPYLHYPHVPLVAPVIVEPAPSQASKVVEARATQTPAVLYGNTLQPRSDPVDGDESTPTNTDPVRNTLAPPREIERPWSTPPGSCCASSSSTVRNVQHFPAEAP